MPVTRGTVALTNGSKAVVGTGTKWISDCVRPGALFALADEHGVIDMTAVYSVAEVGSETSITLDQEYQGETASGLTYAIADAGGEKMSSDVYNLLAAKIGEIEGFLERGAGGSSAGDFVVLDSGGKIDTSLLKTNEANGVLKLDAGGKVAASQMPEAALNQNDNLFDNWFFITPVNQRGLTTYYDDSDVIDTIDRWRSSANLKTELIDDGLRLTAMLSGATPYTWQVIEKPERVAGQTVTVSLDVVQITGRVSVYFSCSGDPTTGMIINAGSTGVKSFTVTLPPKADMTGGLYFVIKLLDDGTTITLRAAEMCAGPAGTLRRGMAADYGEQMTRAMRFLLPLAKDQRFRASCITNSSLQFTIPTPMPMRVAPSVEDASKLSVKTLAAGTVSVPSLRTISVDRMDTALLLIIRYVDGNGDPVAHGLSDALLYVDAATFLNAEM